MGEVLELPASVTDKFSKPLQDLQRRLKDFKATPGLTAVEKHFRGIREQINLATKAVRDAGSGLVNGMGLPGLSVGALSAASAMAALGASVQSFAKNTVSIKNFADATGIAGTKLKELKAVAAGLGIDSDSIEGALRFGAGNYSAMQRGQGNYAAIANLRGGGVDIANRLKGARNADEYTERGLEILNQQKTAEQRRTLSGLIFGSEDMAAFGVEGSAALAKRRAASRSSIGGQSGQDEKSAQAFLDATSKVSASIDKLTNSVGGALAPLLTQLAESINAFSNENAGEVKSFFTDVGKALRDHDWKAEASNVSSVINALKSFATAMQEIQDGAAKAGVWVHDFVAGLPGQVKDQAGKIGEAGKSMVDPKAPGANNGVKVDDLGGYSPIAYRPGARAALTGMASVSSAVATIAAGVTKGMQDFAATMSAKSAPKDKRGSGSADGYQNASYIPGDGVRMGGGGRGGSMSYESARAVVARGSLAKNQKLAYDAAISEGLSPTAAHALVANMSGESLANPSDHHWDVKHMSQGIVQWDPQRAAAIAKKFGKLPKDMSVEEQTRAAIWEMKNKYPKTWKSLNSGGSAESMIDTLVRDYERPGNPGRAVSQRLGFLKGFKQRTQEAENKVNRPSASDAASKKAAADAASAAASKGKVDIHVHSKDQPVTMKTDDSPVFGETKLNRGRSVPLMDL